MRLLPHGPERQKLINEMQDIIQIYAPWIAPWHETQYYVQQPWLMGFKKHPIGHDAWEYVDIAAGQSK